MFCFVAYVANISQQYISLQNGPLCSEVPVNVTASYYASYEGFWEGANGFSSTSAVYYFQFGQMSVTSGQFTDLMMQLKSSVLLPLGTAATQQNLAMNLLIWMNFAIKVNWGGSDQSFSFAGTPGAVFDTAVTEGQFGRSDQMATCPYYPTVSFDVSSAIVSVSIDTTSSLYTSNIELCNLGYLGSASISTNQTIQDLAVDMRTVTTAIAVNIGIANVTMLEKSNEIQIFYFNYTGVEYYLESFVDPNYPGMQPIFCIFLSRTNQLYVCMIQLVIAKAFTYGLPVFNSYNLVNPMVQCLW